MYIKAASVSEFMQPAKAAQTANAGQDIGKQFGQILNDAINRVAENEKQVNELNQAFASGQMQSVEQLLLTSEKASLNLELTVQIRNKVIEAYQEIMRTQI